MLVVVMVFVSLIKEDLFQVIHQCGRSGSNLTHLPHLLIIHVNLHHIHIYFRFRHHQWDLLIHSSVLITHPVQAVFQYGTGRERGRGTREQREEERGGGREGDKEAERLPFISETYFLHYNMQTKTVLGSGLIFKIY